MRRLFPGYLGAVFSPDRVANICLIIQTIIIIFFMSSNDAHNDVADRNHERQPWGPPIAILTRWLSHRFCPIY